MKRLLLLMLSVWATSVFSFPTSSFDTLQTTTSLTVNKQKLRFVSTAFIGSYALGMSGLYSLWYKDYTGSRFHSFNDNGEWLQMDKVGHAFSTFQLSRIGSASYAWTGIPKKKAAFLGTGSALLVMTSVEIFDGYSDHWGFSWGDIAANTLGASFFLMQEMAWQEPRIKFSYSFHQTKYANIRPALLGSTFTEQLLKDYNGQTFWLSGNIRSFAPSWHAIPRWLNLAIGYGAEGMVGGHDNIFSDSNNQIVDYSLKYPRIREYFLSFDIDLTKTNIKPGFLKTLCGTIGMIKIPAPAVELNSQGKMRIHPFYF